MSPEDKEEVKSIVRQSEEVIQDMKYRWATDPSLRLEDNIKVVFSLVETQNRIIDTLLNYVGE